MAYDVSLGNRVREALAHTDKKVVEKEMFGGLCFMVNDKMCAGVLKDDLMCRTDPARFEELTELEGCRPMEFTGKTMRGFLLVDGNSVRSKKELQRWVNLCLDFNDRAKSSKKKPVKKKKQ